MLCTDRYSALAEDNRILACVVLDSPSLTMGSLQGERALCRNRMNEVPGDITHHPKIKSVWGNQLRLKPQTLHRFFVLQLFFFFPLPFLNYYKVHPPIQNEHSVKSFSSGSCADSCSHPIKLNTREHLYPPACTYIKSALKPVVKPDSQ